jgi:hypothetical protein
MTLAINTHKGIETYDDMVRLLSGAKGFDLSRYESDAKPQPRKPLSRLWDEVQKGDITLEINSKTGRAFRRGFSMKTLIQSPKMMLLETARYYEHNDELVPTIHADYSISETFRLRKGAQPTETPFQCVIRALGEELHQYQVDLSQLREISMRHIPSVHPSSVYPGIDSDMIISRYEWNIDAPFDLESATGSDKGLIVRDSGTTVFLKWFER